ncbi:AGAP011003-PA-like protein [Anopheles sinensis]|uniref:AGAP011003-PA-like protein n=1 Tax=Anopheles sinensis TaxID=74873 RepID=A0A084W989_ANOSI|nr:AGAP011003-PA-like protein [Anopheles sinensis]
MVPIVERGQCIDNPKYVNTTVKIHSTSIENRMDLEFAVTRLIENPLLVTLSFLKVSIRLWLNAASGALRAPLYNRTLDFCSFLRNPGQYKLAQIIYKEIKRNGNMPTGCPISVTSYSFRGISLSQMRLPSFFIETDFILDVAGYAGAEKEPVLDSHWFGSVKKVKCTRKERC